VSGDSRQADSEAIQAALQEGAGPDQGDCILTAWAVVAEWMHSDGTRTLTRMHAAGGTLWQAKGLWHEALFSGGWGDE
jgi:hypothetical protein